MGNDQPTDLVARMQGQRLNRRRLVQGAGALGLAVPALGASLRGQPAFAQDAPAVGQLVTVSEQQRSTWLRNFNPFTTDNLWPTGNGVHEPLGVFNLLTGEIVPWLATEWSFSPDNLVLTAKIRDGVMWSDGQPMTARDVAFTFNLFKPENNSGLLGAFMWDYLASVEASDDRTAVFTFGRVFTLGLYDVMGQNIVPEHVWSQVPNPLEHTNENPVATGPFTEIPVFNNQYWELHRNPTYWQEGKPQIQGLRFPAYPGNDQMLFATTNGENDWAGNFIPDIENTYVARDPEHHHYWFPATGDTVMLYLNTTVAPFNDPNVRKAISLGINRDQICAVAMYDYTHPADGTGLSDAFEDWKSPEAVAAGDWVTQDVDRANQMLDAAGLTRDGDVRKLPDGTEMSYDLNVVAGWTDWVSACQIISQDLEALGIRARVQGYEQPAWQERVQTGDFTMSIGWSTGGATPFGYYRGQMSTQRFKAIGESADENWHRYTNPQADELLDQFAATSDEAQQRQIAAQLQMIFAENAPAIPLFPGPQWGEFSTKRFTGFPSEENPYALLSTYAPTRLLVMMELKPVAAQ